VLAWTGHRVGTGQDEQDIHGTRTGESARVLVIQATARTEPKRALRDDNSLNIQASFEFIPYSTPYGWVGIGLAGSGSAKC